MFILAWPKTNQKVKTDFNFLEFRRFIRSSIQTAVLFGLLASDKDTSKTWITTEI